MLQRHLFSHGFTPPSLLLVFAVLLDSVLQTRVYAKQEKCHQLGVVKQGFTLKVADDKAKKLLGNVRTIRECISLSCKHDGANYAVLEDGKCHALYCKKQACQISKDAKSKQKIIGLARKISFKASKKARKTSSLKKSRHLLKAVKKSVKNHAAAKKVSNWTLAFSTVVIPANKTNPLLTHDNELRSEHSGRKKTTKSPHGFAKTTNISKKLRRTKTKSRSDVNNKIVNRKLHRKHAKRRSKAKPQPKDVQTNKTVVNNNSTRHTRDYPYSYYQYQYSPSDKSYQTQETDWRRDMVATPGDSYAAYDNVDKQSLYPPQDDMASISDQVSLNGNSIESQGGNGELFSLPIANLVRRTDIPRSPHHVSSISIVNDMLPDDQNKGYLTDRDSIPVLSSDNRVGYVSNNDVRLQDKSDGIPQSQYTLSSPVQYQKAFDSADSTNARDMAMYPSADSRYTLNNFINNLTGVPLRSFAPLNLQGNRIPVDQAPTASPVVIGSNVVAHQAPPQGTSQEKSVSGTSGPNSSDSSMEMDLTDPGHFPNTKEGRLAVMKKFANISMLSNILPSKEAPSGGDSSSWILPFTDATALPSPAVSSSLPESATISSSSTPAASDYEIKNPVNSLYSALNEASAVHSSLSTAPPVTIFPTVSKSFESGPSISVQDSTSNKPGDIDAPVQNSILPVNSKKEAYTETQSGDGQLPAVKENNQSQALNNAFGSTMDFPFPARLKLPEPSQSISQILSGLSSAAFREPFSDSASYLPSTEDSFLPVTSSAASFTTAKLNNVPIVTTYAYTINQVQATAYDSLYTTNTDKATEYTKSSLLINAASDVLTDTRSQLTSDGPALITTQLDGNDTRSHPDVNAQPVLNSDDNSDITTYNETVVSDGNQTYEVTSDSTDPSSSDGTISSLSVAPTSSSALVGIASSSRILTGHISPETHISYDEKPKHISPISKPKLKLSLNGSVIVLNNVTKQHDINKIHKQSKADPASKSRQKARRVEWLKNGNGCNSPLGMLNGRIADDQIIASSYLSAAYAPAKARLGTQKDSTGGWCADPRLNNMTQYLQVDFRAITDVCRVAMQGHHSKRNWITHYKLSFSMDGRRWSIYRELNKEKVLQGNIGEDDWTSYRLLNPIRTRFIRVLPQAWEGNEICTRVEFYTNKDLGYKTLSERSNIPNAMQNLIDDLNFEKVDNEVVLDSSPMGNNAFLNKGAAVYDSHGRCRHAARIGEGSDILLDGRNMKVKPRQAISLSVWVRVDRTDGVHSIFDTVGSHSSHALGQYHFEIVGGAVRWFHRDENSTEIFSAITEPNFVNPKEWTHLVTSYDSETGDAKIYVNGSRAAESKGRGLLSQDWGGRVGIGRHKDTRDLVGEIDEFRIYNEAIQGEKILELSRECDFDRYYCGSVLTAERGMLITPDYPALHTGPVECVWEIKGIPGEIIAIDVKEFDMNNCNASRLEVRDRDNDTLIGSFCGGNKPTRIESHGSQMIVKFTSSGSKEGERFKVEFHREKRRAAKKTMSSICRNSDLYQNMTLVGGSKAGLFTDLGRTYDMRACQERCCDKETCEVAFMIDGNCYGVRCYDQERCRIRKAKSTALNPMLSFITREGMTPRVFPQFVEINMTTKTTPAQHPASSATPQGKQEKQEAQSQKERKKCQMSKAHYNVTLVRGMKSGNFTSRGLVKDFNECFDKCCQDGNCDAAFMVKRTCFSIKCYDKNSCEYKPARPSSFSPTLAYIIKEQPEANDQPKASVQLETAKQPKTKEQSKVVEQQAKTKEQSKVAEQQAKAKSQLKVDSTGISKSTMVESNACMKSRLSKVYRNVTLRDGIKSGEFTDRGSVSKMDDCVKQCCGDENCNLAFVIKETCFTVKCKGYDTCSLKPAVSRYYNPKIAFVNWSPPKDNLVVGNNKYDYKGCWRDFDMSAFAIPLLEGTDPTLTGVYKKREDPVNECATVSQHRGYSVFAIQNGGACFSGPNADSTYKRYGPSDACKGGRGGAFANSVYKLFDDGSVMSLGCWADLQDRAFRRMEKIDDALQETFVSRADPIGVCGSVAKKHNSKMFALQKGGQCFIGKNNPDAYTRYGPSRKCKYGLGGQMANDVYILKDANDVTASGPNVEQDQPAQAVLKNTTDIDTPNPTDSQESQTTTTTPATTTAAATTATPTTTSASTATTASTTASTTTSQTTTATTTVTTATTTNTPPTTGANSEATQGTVGQTTITSKANAKSKDTSKNPGESLQPGEVVYKEELTDTEHIKFIYSANSLMANVTLTSGISAGTFTDKGAIENMDDCVKSCGQTSNCDVAFKLGKQCFGVACYSSDTCQTKPAFSAYYNPLITLVKHRTIKTPRFKEETHMESNPTQRSLCKAKNSAENVTLVDGIGAGNFTDLGHVADMNDCVSRCCANSACELAFRIEDDCYGVTCHSERSCRTRSARNSMSLRPMIAIVRDVGSRQELSEKPSLKQSIKTTEKQSKRGPKCSSDVWEGDVRENVTLMGGINAGEFTDHGPADNIEECMGYCCESKECDLAFMIDKDCYGVKCKDPSNCKTRPARPTKYRPIIAFKKSSESANGKERPNIDKLEQLFITTETNKLNGGGQRKSAGITQAKTAKIEADDGLGVMVKPVVDISKAMFKDRTTVEDDADGNSFAARSYYSPLTTNSPNRLTSTRTATKTTMTVIPRPPGTTPGFTSTLIKSTASATPTFGDPSTKHSCEAGSIAYNATLKMGMHSGLFTKLGRVAKMDDCIERCCKSSNADVAFMLGSVCFAVKCYSAELCKVAPAMISNIGNLNMNPTLSFLKKKASTMSVGNDNNDIDAIIDEITDKTDESETNQVTYSEHRDLLSRLENISTTWEVHDRIRPNPKKPADDSPQEVCANSPITYNVTLKGGIHAGNFTNQGEGLSDRECINKCCTRKSCDLAFMFADLCYSVKCNNEDDCQAVVAKPSSLNPKVSFVSRSKQFADRGTMFDVTTTMNEDEGTCDEAKIKHSPIMSNKTLAGGLNAGNFTYLGRTSNMKECLGKCCGAKKCDVAYRIDRDCFSVKCFSPELCKVSEAPAKNGFVQFATMTQMEKIKLNTRSVAVYVMLGSVIFVVLISGVGMALCSWRKRRQMKSQHQQTEDTPLPDR